MKKFIYYLPRVLSVLIVAFFAMFILEGFDPEFGWQSGLSHALLAFAALLAAIAAWKWPGTGGWIFVAFGAWYLWSIFASGWRGGLVIGGVPLLAGILFLIEGSKNKKEGIDKKDKI
jgi:hypothetical protein